jgi:hypothetical protein
LASGGGVGSGVALAAPGGYLDSAIPMTMVRLRTDAAYDLNRPDRAEYIYGTWAELGFHPHGINHGGVFFDPNARGPSQIAASLNYQEISAYAEYAFNNRWSAFIEVPYKMMNFKHIQEDPDVERTPTGGFYPEPDLGEAEDNDNNPNGFSDIQFGFKAAMIACPNQYLTFQFRSYAPTGNARLGLGTGHWSMEPSLLYYEKMDNWTLQGQFTVWVPINGGPAAGPILQYGAGLGYDIYKRGKMRVVPILEVVGWTVLYGFESEAETPGVLTPIIFPSNNEGLTLPVTHGVENAAGATIVDVKGGVRTYLGTNSDFYVGYGHAVTGSRWYNDIIRVEYRYKF